MTHESKIVQGERITRSCAHFGVACLLSSFLRSSAYNKFVAISG